MDIAKIKFTQNPSFMVYKIGDLLEFYSRKCELISDEEYQLVTVKRRNEGIVNRGKFKGKEIKTPTQFYIKTGDFLISKRQIVHGACEIVPHQFDSAIVSNEYTVAKGKQGLLSTEYFNLLSKTSFMKKHYLLSSYGVDIEKMVFNVEDWKKRAIYVPSIEEQQKVVDFFSTINKKIQFQQEKINLLKEQKKGYMQKIFKQEIRFKDNGGDYPSWEIKELNRVSEINPKSPSLNDEFYYIDLESVENGVLVKVEVVSKKDAPSRAQRVVQKDDILYQTVRPYQKNNYYVLENKSTQTVASTGYAQIRVKKDINAIYLYQYLQTSEFTNSVLKSCTGTSYPAINSSDLGNLTIKIPSLKEQIKIANCLSKLDEKIQLEQQKLEVLQKQKKGFMQQMFI